jgi:hypothetical protein
MKPHKQKKIGTKQGQKRRKTKGDKKPNKKGEKIIKH